MSVSNLTCGKDTPFAHYNFNIMFTFKDLIKQKVYILTTLVKTNLNKMPEVKVISSVNSRSWVGEDTNSQYKRTSDM